MSNLTLGPQVEKFFHTYLRHTKGERAGKRFDWEPWQRDFGNEFYRVDSNGKRIYRLGILGIPRGNGKSPTAAGFGLYELMSRRDAPDVFCIAGSRGQAAVVMDFARSFVDGGKLKTLGVTAQKRSITYPQTGGVMRVLSSQGSLQHGLIPSAVIPDELHAFKTEEQEETWHAMWTALHKRPNAFAMPITTAGFNKHSLLGKMYDAAVLLDGEDRDGGCLRIRRDYENGVLFWWYGIPEQLENDWDNEELWRLANPASWISVDTLRQQLNAPGVDELDFKRLHCNMWTASREAWLPPGSWRALVSPAAIAPGSDLFVGVDVGWYHDSTAVVWAARSKEPVEISFDDRPSRVFPAGTIILRAKVWTTVEGQLGTFVPGGRMQLELVENFIRDELARDYRIREIAYDPAYFGRSVEILDKLGFTPVEMLPSSEGVFEAWQDFKIAVQEQKITHDGDATLAAHVEAAGVRMSERGPKVRKLRSSARIDALAAAVMAHARCSLYSGGSMPTVFWFDPSDM